MITCRESEGDQVSEEVTGKVSFALMQRGGDLPADLLRQLGTHHGRDALSCLLAHLKFIHTDPMKADTHTSALKY